MIHTFALSTVYDTGIHEGIPYIAMQYVEGETLGRKIATAADSQGAESDRLLTLDDREDATRPGSAPTRPPTLRTPDRTAVISAARLIEKTARALHLAHESGIIHRDIKPGNVMVTPVGEPVLLDFGLAHQDLGEEPSLTRTGDLFGTPAYMSPEQLTRKSLRLDRRTDIWSLGAVLYEAVTFKQPFTAPTREALYHAILMKEPDAPCQVNRAVPKDVGVIVETALQKDRDRRYQTALAMADDLAACLDGRPIVARPVGFVGRTVRWMRRELVKAALLLTILTALPAIATLVTMHVTDWPRLEEARRARIKGANDELLSEASFELAEGDAHRAMTLFESVLAMEGGSPEAAAGLVLAYLRLKQPESALSVLDTYAAHLRGRAAASLLRADALEALHRKDEARTVRDAAPEPRDALDFHLLAERELRAAFAGDNSAHGRALKHTSRALLHSSGARLLLLELRAQIAGGARDREAVLDVVAALDKHWAHASSAHFWRGLALTALGDEPLYEPAAAAYREATRLRPENFLAHTQLGWTLCELGHADEAITACREAIRLKPEYGPAHANLGAAFHGKGLLDEAIAACQQAIRFSPDCWSAYDNLGRTLKKKGHLAEVAAAFREASRLNPGDAGVHINLGETLRLQGLVSDAIAAFRESIKIRSDIPEAHFNLGVALRSEGRTGEALAELQKAARLDPGRENFHYHLGIYLNEIGRYEEAINPLSAAVQLVPDDAINHDSLAQAFFRTGRIDDAMREWREAIRHDRDRDLKGTYGNLALALEWKDLDDEALPCWQEQVRRSPGDPEGRCRLGRVLAAADRDTEALEAYQKAIELRLGEGGVGNASAAHITECRRFVEAARQMEALLAAGREPESAEELATLARLALAKGHSVITASWYSKAFACDPSIFEDLSVGHRYRAACAAVEAAGVTASDPVQLVSDTPPAGTLRRLALAWLQDELHAWEERLDAERVRPDQVRRTIDRWQRNPRLAPVREDAGLRALTAVERKEWESLWARAASLHHDG